MDEDSSLNRLIFAMSSEESSVTGLVIVPTTVVVQGDQQQENALDRPRNGRLRLRRDQWLYESLPDDDDGHDDRTADREKTTNTKSQQHTNVGEAAEGEGGEKGTPSRGGNGEEGNMLDTVLLLCVKGVLAGVQGFWLLQWVLGRLSDVLTKVVEFGLLLLGIQPSTAE